MMSLANTVGEAMLDDWWSVSFLRNFFWVPWRRRSCVSSWRSTSSASTTKSLSPPPRLFLAYPCKSDTWVVKERYVSPLQSSPCFTFILGIPLLSRLRQLWLASTKLACGHGKSCHDLFHALRLGSLSQGLYDLKHTNPMFRPTPTWTRKLARLRCSQSTMQFRRLTS